MESILYEKNDVERAAALLEQQADVSPISLNRLDTALSRGALIGHQLREGLLSTATMLSSSNRRTGRLPCNGLPVGHAT